MTDTSVPEQPPPAASALARVVDFRIPLPWLLSGFIFAAGLFINMFYKIQQMSDSLQDLQVTVKAGNAMATSFAGELALLKYRVDTLEAAQRGAHLAQPPR